MLAATALVAVFVGIVVAVTQLQRRGRLGPVDREVEFRSYGPVLAAACSGGAAAVHVAVVGEHTALAVADGTPDAFALLCSIGAGTTHFSSSEIAIAGFLPLGVLSIGAIGAQAAFAVPRLWRDRRVLLLGLGVTLGALAVALAARILAPAPPAAAASLGLGAVGGAATNTQHVAYSDWLAIVFDGVLVLVISLLAFGRPRALAERLRVSVADAWVGTGLGVAAVGVFTVAGFFLAHSTP
jgi:hypothetical protein